MHSVLRSSVSLWFHTNVKKHPRAQMEATTALHEMLLLLLLSSLEINPSSPRVCTAAIHLLLPPLDEACCCSAALSSFHG